MDKSLDSLKPQKQLDLYYFGEFRIDTRKRRLWHDEELVLLTPKEFEVLFFLVEHAGQIAEKNELLDAVWTNTYVEEATLARNISWLRKKLKKYSKGEKYIETIPKRGYRFIADVTKSNKDENLIIIEEQTIQQILAEETIIITDENLEKPFALPQVGSKSKNQYLNFKLIALGLIVLFGAGFAIYQNYSGKGEIKAIVAKRVVALTGETGIEDSPRFSPDGMRIVFTWDRGDEKNGDIYVRLVNRGDSLKLTNSKLNDRYPTFSPDGTEIAFVRDYKKYAELITIPSLGGTERVIRRVFSGDYSMSYSPDGENIAVIDTENSKGGGQYAIYLVNTKTFERKRLTTEGNFRGETTPRFSPDGKSLAFIRMLEKEMDLFVVPSTGGEPRRITFDNETIHSLAWDRKGENIFFVSKRKGNKSRLWRISAAGGEPEVVSIEGGGLVNIAISPNGKTLAYTLSQQIGSIYRVKPDGQPPQKIISSNSTNFVRDISPDGSRILFVSDRIRALDLWTADTEGNNLLRITDSMNNIGRASYSHDGSLIGFHGSIRDSKKEGAFVVSAQGGKIREIKAEGHLITRITFGAAGKWIYFFSNKTGDQQIWKIRSDGSGEPIQITRDGGVFPEPTADGKMIYYQKTLSGDSIWRVPVNGGKEEKVNKIYNAGFNTPFRSITDNGIYFLVRNEDKSHTVKFYNFAADMVSDSVGDYKIPPNITGRIVSNGENIIFSMTETTSNIMLADISE